MLEMLISHYSAFPLQIDVHWSFSCALLYQDGLEVVLYLEHAASCACSGSVLPSAHPQHCCTAEGAKGTFPYAAFRRRADLSQANNDIPATYYLHDLCLLCPCLTEGEKAFQDIGFDAFAPFRWKMLYKWHLILLQALFLSSCGWCSNVLLKTSQKKFSCHPEIPTVQEWVQLLHYLDRGPRFWTYTMRLHSCSGQIQQWWWQSCSLSGSQDILHHVMGQLLQEGRAVHFRMTQIALQTPASWSQWEFECLTCWLRPILEVVEVWQDE